MPTAWWLRPVRMQARVGEQSAVTWKRLYRSPPCASRSMLGVSMFEPKQPSCAKPVSSSSTTTTFGGAAIAFTLRNPGGGRSVRPRAGVALAGLGLVELGLGAFGDATSPRQLGLEPADLLAGAVERGLGLLAGRRRDLDPLGTRRGGAGLLACRLGRGALARELVDRPRCGPLRRCVRLRRRRARPSGW